MGRLISYGVFVFIFTFISVEGYNQQAKHVVLISIDGLRPEFYLDKEWNTPNLKRLASEGVYAKEVKSVFPSVTYPAHTTIITGAYPARHGIYYNETYSGKKGEWYWEDSLIKVPTIWDAAKKKGLTSASVMWPVTVAAPIDFNFPPRRGDGDDKREQLEVTRPYITPADLLTAFESNEKKKLTSADFDANNSSDVTIGKLGSYIIKTHKPNLVALHFVTADHLQHDHNRNDQVVKRGVALIDSMIGVILKSVNDAGLKKNTAIIVTGDHGFVNSSITFSPNVLLEMNGLFDKKDVRFHSTGGAAVLYIKGEGQKSTLQRIKALLNDLPADKRSRFRIVDRDELDKVGANPEIAMALALSKNVVANNDSKGELWRAKKFGGSHGYYPDFDEISTGFIAAGAGIGKHEKIETMGIKDIAPLISQLLGLSFNAPDGVLIPGILKNK